MSNEELLTTMFAVHGKRPMDAQFNEYLKIFDQLGFDKSQKVFRHVRDAEDKFPTIKQLWGIIKSLGLIEKKQSQLENYSDCYYCGGVGYIPYLLSPKRDKRITNYNTVVYACKCSAGQDVPTDIRRYFDTFDDVQFKDSRDGVNYAQLVTSKQREYANKLNEEKKNEGVNRGADSRRINSLERKNLREELEEIASGNTET